MIPDPAQINALKKYGDSICDLDGFSGYFAKAAQSQGIKVTSFDNYLLPATDLFSEVKHTSRLSIPDDCQMVSLFCPTPGGVKSGYALNNFLNSKARYFIFGSNDWFFLESHLKHININTYSKGKRKYLENLQMLLLKSFSEKLQLIEYLPHRAISPINFLPTDMWVFERK